MAKKDDSAFMSVIKQVAEEKGLDLASVLEAVGAAIAAAYRKDFGQKEQVVAAEIDPTSEKTRIFVVRRIVEEVIDPVKEISLKEAKRLERDAQLGGEIREEVFPPAEYGRVAAQTAKQVIMQKFREAERALILQAYKNKEGSILNGVVQRIENGVVFVDLSKAVGVLFPSEQSKADHYRVGQRLKVYLMRVEESGSREPQLILSRAHPETIKRLFEMEVPEIAAGTVEIKSIAREAGVRSKVAVASNQEAVDPVGSLVGRRGVRVQVVMGEIGDEKIDIVLWDEDPAKFIVNALAPAKVKEVILDERSRRALVRVDDDQLSLVIGRNGQNVRLASKLSGYQIDVEKKQLAATGQSPSQAGAKEEGGKKEKKNQLPTEAPVTKDEEPPASA